MKGRKSFQGNIIGHKKEGTETLAIKDPGTEELLVPNRDIKKATLAYCLTKKSDYTKDSFNNVTNLL